MPDFTLKKGDRAPSLAATLEDRDGNAVDLSAVNGVRFVMADRPEHLANKVAADAVVTDGVNGKVRYDWQSGDTDTPGLYDVEWVVTYGTGKEETFPSDEYTVIEVVEELPAT